MTEENGKKNNSTTKYPMSQSTGEELNKYRKGGRSCAVGFSGLVEGFSSGGCDLFSLGDMSMVYTVASFVISTDPGSVKCSQQSSRSLPRVSDAASKTRPGKTVLTVSDCEKE